MTAQMYIELSVKRLDGAFYENNYMITIFAKSFILDV